MTDTYEINFVWPHTEANDVVVIGNFDSWDPSNGHRLKRFDSGFEGKVAVPWGFKVLYKFLVDGQWLLLDNHPTEVDPIGNVNNVYQVPTKPETHEMQASQTSGVIGPREGKFSMEDAKVSTSTTVEQLTTSVKDAVLNVAEPVITTVTETIAQPVDSNGITHLTSAEKSVVDPAEINTDRDNVHEEALNTAVVVDELKQTTAQEPTALEEIKEDETKAPELPVGDELRHENGHSVSEETKVEETSVVEAPAIEEVASQQQDTDLKEAVVIQPEVVGPTENAVVQDHQVESVEPTKTSDETLSNISDVLLPILPVADATIKNTVDTEPKPVEISETKLTEEPSTHQPAVIIAATTDDDINRSIPPAVSGTEVELEAPILPTTVAAPAEKIDDKIPETIPMSTTTTEAGTSIPVTEEVENKPPTPKKDEPPTPEKDVPTVNATSNTSTLAVPTTNEASAPPTPMKQRFPSGSGLDDGTDSVHSKNSGTPRKKKLSIFGKIKEVIHGAEDKLLHHGHSRRASSTTASSTTK